MAFGGSPDEAKLRLLATLGGGTFDKALTSGDLLQVFKTIASSQTLQTKLIDKFGDAISSLGTCGVPGVRGTASPVQDCSWGYTHTHTHAHTHGLQSLRGLSKLGSDSPYWSA